MGLYFNTAATRDIADKVNEQFTGPNIDFWKTNQRKHFNKKNGGGKTLKWIANQNRIEPDDGTKKPNWEKWLDDLEDDTGDRMRDIFFEHLNPASNCKEIHFVPVLSASMPIQIFVNTPVSVPGGYSLTVNIHTPIAKVVRAAIQKRKDAIARRRAANKKKA